MSEKKEFIPELTINNTSEKKNVEIDGKMQEVELPAAEGFNVTSKVNDDTYVKEFFGKDLSGVILYDKYQIRSKYKVEPSYISNEFEFVGKENHLKVWSNDEKRYIYEGDHKGAKEHFATGEMTSAGTPAKSFDTYTILYVAVEGTVYKFKWKMNQNNTWFEYKGNSEQERGDANYRSFVTNFVLEKKQFGSNEFWACHLEKGEDVDRGDYDEMVKELTAEKMVTQEDLSNMGTEIKIEEIPF